MGNYSIYLKEDMGCKGSKDVSWNFGKETRSMSLKNAEVLEKWTMGAAARVKVLNMRRRFMKGITNLPKPTI